MQPFWSTLLLSSNIANIKVMDFKRNRPNKNHLVFNRHVNQAIMNSVYNYSTYSFEKGNESKTWFVSSY